MQWSESGWVVDLEIDNDSKTEFKFVIVLENGDLIWEDGPNRVLELSKGGTFELYSKWNDTKGSIVKGVKEEHDENGSASAVQKQEEESIEIAEISSDATLVEDESIDELPISSSFVQEWQGRNISFMRSNEHNREKKGKWDVSGLEGSALYLVDGDRTASNWWRKVGCLSFYKFGSTRLHVIPACLSIYKFVCAAGSGY
jgi:phosphoglucan,water dikinase